MKNKKENSLYINKTIDSGEKSVSTIIICCAADDSLHLEWYSDKKNYDLCVVYYGNNRDISNKFKKSSDFFIEKKGEKLNMVFDIVSDNKTIFDNYEYIWVPDCDISIGVNDLNEFFEISKNFELYLSQPAQTGHISHLITTQHRGNLLRFTSFVEIVAPLFKTEIFYNLMFTFKLTYSAAGLDFIWPKILNYPEDKIAIIDKVVMNHTKPIGLDYSRFERNPSIDFYENMEKFDLIPEKGIQYATTYSSVIDYPVVTTCKKKNNIKYIYCTIAIGKKYYDISVEFAKKLNKVSKNHQVLIVTDQKPKKIKNCNIQKVPKELTLFYPNGCFNYNLKYYPIKLASESQNEVIIYFDADWIIGPDYKESKIESFIDFFITSEFDFLFERPHYILGKHDWNTCFWRHKIEPYKLMETDKYDFGHVCNEQFLAFKNNDKLKIFTEAWGNRDKFSVENNIWPFAEGLEIGMSSIDAEMKFSWDGFYFLNSCFMFYSNSSYTPLIRF
jgi:hypothetical protein